MLRKAHNQPKHVNTANKKYVLPSSSQNRNEAPQHQESRLNKLKRSITNKYKGTYSTLKNNSKRPSVSKIQHLEHLGESISSQINLNDDVSFEIVGIRDVQQKPKSLSRRNSHKTYRYPLGQTNSNTFIQKKPKQTNFALTFGSQNHQNKAFQSSKALQNISKINDLQKLTKSFPKPQKKVQFDRFLQNLHLDEKYQNTITMFTIMYFYEQKEKKK